MSKKMIVAVLASLTMLAAAPAANALTATPLPVAQEAPAVTLVSGGCGPYAHRGPFGGCRPNGFRGCPPGFHLGPYGQRCLPDRRF